MFRGLRFRGARAKLVHSWTRYRELVLNGLRMTAAGPEREEEFQGLKKKLARELQTVAESSAARDDEATRGQLNAIASMLGAHTTIAALGGGRISTPEEFESLWNAHYVFLSGLRGARSRAPDARRNVVKVVPTGMGRDWVPRRFSPGRLVAPVLLLVLLGGTGYLFDGVYDVGRSADGRFVVTKESAKVDGVPEMAAGGGAKKSEPRADAAKPAREPTPEPTPAPEETPRVDALLYDEVAPSVRIVVGSRASGWLRKGHSFEGWTVTEIAPVSVTLSSEGRTETIQVGQVGLKAGVGVEGSGRSRQRRASDTPSAR